MKTWMMRKPSCRVRASTRATSRENHSLTVPTAPPTCDSHACGAVHQYRRGSSRGAAAR